MALMLSMLGFRVLATEGTHRTLILNGIDSELVLKHTVGLQLKAELEEDARKSGQPVEEIRVTTIVDMIEAGDVDLVINIPRGRGARSDGYEIRRAALRRGVPAMTNAAAAHAAVQAIAGARKTREITVTCLQDLHSRLAISAQSGRAGARE
jgi:carbamoyl-phosphate synthase large subunit